MEFNFKSKKQADTFVRKLRKQFILPVRVSDYVVGLYNVRELKEPMRIVRQAANIYYSVLGVA